MILRDQKLLKAGEVLNKSNLVSMFKNKCLKQVKCSICSILRGNLARD